METNRKKAGLTEHFSGLAAGFYCFSLAVFDNELYVKLIYLAAAAMVLAFLMRVFFSRQKAIQYPGFLWFYVALAVWASLSTLWAINPQSTLHWMLTTAQIAVSIFLLVNLLTSSTARFYVFVWMLLAVGVNVAVYLGIIHIGKVTHIGSRYVGMLGNANELCRSLLMFFVVALYVVVAQKTLNLRMIAMLGMVGAFMLIFATESRTGIVVSGLFLAGSILLSRGKVFMLPMVIIGGYLAMTLLSQSGEFQELLVRVVDRFLPWLSTDSGLQRLDSSTAGRIQMGKSAWEMFTASPAIGHGIGAFHAEYGGYTHNAPLDLLANLGIVGLTIWWACYYVIFRQIIRNHQGAVRIAGLLALGAAFLFEMSDVFYAKRTGVALLTLILVYFGSGYSGDRAQVASPTATGREGLRKSRLLR